MENVHEIRYRCSRCNSEDTVKLFEGETLPVAVNCWHCHAGFRVEVSVMLENNIGMFPVLAQQTQAVQ